ncbi:hypothetical protein B0T25DRAFT_8905 [Lasiosphaeria hispida]|uniref:Uncharacterized protein n=1 Tax=Lasiosphaeria hispida TaxID=260671 RepID=A0AAJ0MJA6_9PEZI|nr:hypothetical protein B0T25DRAFT_8905 [Lasiosphaeria hispida]
MAMTKRSFFPRRSPWLLLALLARASPTLGLTAEVDEWLKDPGYEQGGTIQEQIRCYALPFGAIGFASHILTYLTVLCLATGRSPFWPRRKLTGRKLNLALGFIGLGITLPLTVLVMVRCRNTRSFLLIAVWKLMLSVTLSFMTIHAARLIDDRKAKDSRIIDGSYEPVYGGYSDASKAASLRANPFGKIMWWSILYFAGAIIGFVGVVNLVRLNFSAIWELRVITYTFGGVLLGVPMLCMLVFFYQRGGGGGFIKALSGLGLTVFAGFVILTALIALYTDWVLAALAGDWVGVPSSDNQVFYWTYFAAKRLPMISF